MSSDTDPSMPYDVHELPFGTGRTRLCKKPRDGAGFSVYLTDDEVAVLDYVRWLERRLEEALQKTSSPKQSKEKTASSK